MLLAAVATALGVLVLGARPRRLPRARAPAGRSAATGSPAAADGSARRPAGRARRPPRVAFATGVTALGAFAIAGPRAGPVAALLAVALLPRALGGLPARAEERRDHARAAALPLLADVTAACVAAGAPLDAAVEQAARLVGGPLGADAAAAVRAVRLGVPPRVAWTPLLARERPAPVRAYARALVRSTDSGAAPATVLRAVADDARAAARTAGEAAARRAAVAAVLPLGLCFLPAFVLVGVVPLVAGLLAGTL